MGSRAKRLKLIVFVVGLVVLQVGNLACSGCDCQGRMEPESTVLADVLSTNPAADRAVVAVVEVVSGSAAVAERIELKVATGSPSQLQVGERYEMPVFADRAIFIEGSCCGEAKVRFPNGNEVDRPFPAQSILMWVVIGLAAVVPLTMLATFLGRLREDGSHNN